MDNQELNDVLSNIVSVIDERFEWQEIHGLENMEFQPNKIMTLSLIIINNEKPRSIFSELKDYNDARIWGQLSRDIFSYINHNFDEKPEQFIFEIDSNYSFTVNFKYDIFNKHNSFTQEKLFWQYINFGIIPNSDFFKKQLNKSLTYHKMKNV